MTATLEGVKPGAQIKEGDTVRVDSARLPCFIKAFANQIADRDAIVNWVGPDKHGQFAGYASVTFQKRGNRGKEFRERMYIRDLVLVKSAVEQDGKEPA